MYKKLCGRPPQYAPAPCKLTFDRLTSKVVSESRVTWSTSVPVLVFLGLSVLDLGPMYATVRRETRIVALCLRTMWAGHNSKYMCTHILRETIDNGIMHRTQTTGISLLDSGFCRILRQFWGEVIIEHHVKGINVKMVLLR